MTCIHACACAARAAAAARARRPAAWPLCLLRQPPGAAFQQQQPRGQGAHQPAGGHGVGVHNAHPLPAQHTRPCGARRGARAQRPRQRRVGRGLPGGLGRGARARRVRQVHAEPCNTYMCMQYAHMQWRGWRLACVAGDSAPSLEIWSITSVQKSGSPACRHASMHHNQQPTHITITCMHACRLAG